MNGKNSSACDVLSPDLVQALCKINPFSLLPIELTIVPFESDVRVNVLRGLKSEALPVVHPAFPYLSASAKEAPVTGKPAESCMIGFTERPSYIVPPPLFWYHLKAFWYPSGNCTFQ